MIVKPKGFPSKKSGSLFESAALSTMAYGKQIHPLLTMRYAGARFLISQLRKAAWTGKIAILRI